MIDKQTVLSLTNGGLNVFRHYFGNGISTRRKFRNPFYEDTHPSCSLYFDSQRGIYKYKDFGNEDYSGDCFDLVATLHNLSCRNTENFIEILRIIDRELNLGIEDASPTTSPRILPKPPAPPPKPQEPLPYKYQRQPFPAEELAHWKQYGIDAETLNRYGVVSLAEYCGRNYTLFTPMIIMKNKKPTTGYCSQYLCCIKAQTFQDIVKELNELAEKHSTDDFDEVVITVSLGRNCTSPIRCQPCIFHKPSSKRSQMQDNSKK